MSVRRAEAADAAAIAALLAELGYPATAADVAERLAGTAALVAELGGQIVGVLTLSLVPVLHEGGDWCRITMLVVAGHARRQGVARALVAETEAIARDRGCVRIEVTSALDRDGAHEFYRGMGYGQVSQHFLKPLAGAHA